MVSDNDSEPKKRGRPSVYTRELAQEICIELSKGKTLLQVCKPENMPCASTVRNWALSNHDGFFADYAQAREIGYQVMADELLEISDDGSSDFILGESAEERQFNGEHVQRSRLRVDTRKWLLSKALPKIYGDRITAEHTGADGAPLIVHDDQQLARAMLAIIARAKLDDDERPLVLEHSDESSP